MTKDRETLGGGWSSVEKTRRSIGPAVLLLAGATWLAGCKDDPRSGPVSGGAATTPSSSPATVVVAPSASGAKSDPCGPGTTPASCQAACDQGSADACGVMGDAPGDPARSAKLHETACNGGILRACNQLASHYLKGDGVPADRARAKALYEKSCNGGNAKGCRFLGAQFHADDDGVAKDSDAITLFTKACELQDGDGCFWLGNAYVHGNVVTKSVPKAQETYGKGCDLKSGAACEQLGSLYSDGDDLPQDLQKAAGYFKQGCDLKDDLACRELDDVNKGNAAIDTTFDDLAIGAAKWNGKVARLRNVAVWRGSPSSGYTLPVGGHPSTDGIATMMADDADDDVKKTWLHVPNGVHGSPVAKLVVRVQATLVPGKSRLYVVDLTP